jgi:hypothetical protein
MSTVSEIYRLNTKQICELSDESVILFIAMNLERVPSVFSSLQRLSQKRIREK